MKFTVFLRTRNLFTVQVGTKPIDTLQNARLPYQCRWVAESAHRDGDDVMPFQTLLSDSGYVEYVAC